MDPSNILSTLASIAASLVGFSGLLTAFRSANDRLGPNDVNNIRTLLIFSVSALVFALIPLPFAGRLSASSWTLFTVVLGANLLFWSLQSPRWMRRKRLRPRNPGLFVAMISLQAVIAVVLVIGAFVGGPAATLYLVGVLWFLVAAMVVFVVQTFRMLPVDTEPDA